MRGPTGSPRAVDVGDDGSRLRRPGLRGLSGFTKEGFGPFGRPVATRVQESNADETLDFWVRLLVSAYSQNEVAGTMQRFCLPSQPRQCGLPTLRMSVVIGAPPNCNAPSQANGCHPISCERLAQAGRGKFRGTSEVACTIVARGANPVADRGLAFGQTAVIAHGRGPL